MWYIISTAQLEQYLDENRWIYLVDMRDRASYAQSHIRGAVNIPDEEFWGRVGELPVDRLLILYCYRGPRSMLAARELARYGYQVADICGGIEAYRGKYLEGCGSLAAR
ncbi:MAG: rhodanese-like domain-containing protein [Lachnospiraceae bacterium]|jgi:rhodanese-related sulfurtransferase|nr:rhodanese-like domain-containing protein [Lachnospiraceae bacterium]